MCFETFERHDINIKTGRIMRPIHIYLAASKIYPKKFKERACCLKSEVH